MLLLLTFLLLAWYLVDLAANLLNARSLAKELPPTFQGIYDQERYRRLQEYNQAQTALELWASTAALAVLLLFLWLGGYAALDRLVRSWDLGFLTTALLFIGLLAAGAQLVQLPFDLYHTFAIEERFGFNRTSFRTWLTDKIKATMLAGIIGSALLALILTILQYAGSWAWLYGWAVSILFMLLITWVAPSLIMPLFNKFTPLEPGELHAAICNFAKANDFPVAGIFVMDGSRRSNKSNAFFTGLGKSRKIVLFDTLVAQHGVQELVAVLAHEIGHYKLRHIPKRLFLAAINFGCFFGLAHFVLRSPVFFESFGLAPSIYAGLAIFMLFYTPLSRFLGIVALSMSRRHEFEADRFAAVSTSRAEDLIAGLRKLAEANLSNLEPHWFYVLLYHSHPPVLERIAALRRLNPAV